MGKKIIIIKIAIVKNNIAIRIAGKVSRYIDASMNRATPTLYPRGRSYLNRKGLVVLVGR